MYYFEVYTYEHMAIAACLIKFTKMVTRSLVLIIVRIQAYTLEIN